MRVEFSKSDMAELDRSLSGIKKGSTRVLTQAINKTVKTIATQARVRIGNELNLKSDRISKDLSTQKATFSDLSGAVIAKGRPVGLVSYGAKRYGAGKGKGIKVKIKRKGGFAKLKHAFIANGKRGQALSSDINQHVFFRQMIGGKRVARYPLETLHGPRIEDIYASDKVFKPIQIQAGHVFALNVDKGIADILRRFG